MISCYVSFQNLPFDGTVISGPGQLPGQHSIRGWSDIAVYIGINIVQVGAADFGKNNVHRAAFIRGSIQPLNLAIGNDVSAVPQFEFNHEKSSALQGSLAADTAAAGGYVV